MTTPSSTISLSDVNTELSLSSSSVISMNDTNVRNLAGKSSGVISMDDLRNKSSVFNFGYHVNFNATDFNVRTYAINAGWDQKTVINISLYIDSGYTISSSSVTTPALETGTFPAGSTLTITNNGTIVGRGGIGGAGGTNLANGSAGGGGGPAINISYSCTIVNNGTIGGGGGGGGGGNGGSSTYSAGGGGGGGAGYGTGGPSQSGGAQNLGSPGNTGGATTGGAGGTSVYQAGTGGTGGGLAAAGSAGQSQWVNYFTLRIYVTGGTGGSGGAAINKNGYTVGISGSGNTYGAINT